MIERQRKEKEENEEKERNRKETKGHKNWTFEAGESDDLPQFSHDIASMRKDRKQRRRTALLENPDRVKNQF